jgi:hypothetical protein
MAEILGHAITVRDVLYVSGGMIALVLFFGAFAMWKVNRGDWR